MHTAPTTEKEYIVPVEITRVVRTTIDMRVAAMDGERARRVALKAARRVSTLAIAMQPGPHQYPAPVAGEARPAPPAPITARAPTRNGWESSRAPWRAGSGAGIPILATEVAP